MRDKIELLIEETGASPQEAELALGLANFDMENALVILQTKMRDVFVLKSKFLNQEPRLYGLMLLIANVSKKRPPSFRVRFVWSDIPHIYETNLHLHWYDFEKAIYRARLSERSFVSLSQDLEKLLEARFAQSPSALVDLKEAVESANHDHLEVWIREFLESSGFFWSSVKFAYETEILNLREFRESPSFNPELMSLRRFPHSGEVFVSLRIGLTNSLPEDCAEVAHEMAVSELRAGDSVFICVLENRDTALYLAELLGALSDYGLVPIEAPIESVWEEGALTGVRVRFGRNIVGEGLFHKTLRVAAVRRATPPQSFLSRLLRF